jgi:hypothetical protein
MLPLACLWWAALTLPSPGGLDPFPLSRRAGEGGLMRKSFLVLFYKKEHFSLLQKSLRAGIEDRVRIEAVGLVDIG